MSSPIENQNKTPVEIDPVTLSYEVFENLDDKEVWRLIQWYQYTIQHMMRDLDRLQREEPNSISHDRTMEVALSAAIKTYDGEKIDHNKIKEAAESYYILLLKPHLDIPEVNYKSPE